MVLQMDNMTYWKLRERKALNSYLKQEIEYENEIRLTHQVTMHDIQEQINSFYIKYATKEGISLAEAQLKVSQLDIDAYAKKAKQYVATKDLSKQANEEMRIYNLTMKINRFELLKANIGMTLVSNFDELEKFFDEKMSKRVIDEFTRQAGILGSTVFHNDKMVKSIVNASFHNATFSERIWGYNSQLKAYLDVMLKQGIIQGKNPMDYVKELQRLFGSSEFQAIRLLRTEMARIQTDVQKKSYERNGYTLYVFICNHDEKTCEVCKELDGQKFAVSEMMPGENAPPMHAFCRCSTAAVFDEESYNAWLDAFQDNPMTYEDYIKSVDIAGGSSIIKSGALNPESREADLYAERYYNLVRSMTNDVNRISENTGLSSSDINIIKQYLFIEEHDLGDQKKRFDASYYIAQSWQRLIDGKRIKTHDLTLLKHEMMEKDLVNKGMSQNEAHIKTTRIYDYGKESELYYDQINKHKKIE